MTQKNPSNDPDQVKQDAPPSPQYIEKSLLPRLKFMGYLMSTFCAATLLFALLSPGNPGQEPEAALEGHPPLKTSGPALMTDEDPLDLNPTEVLNFYVVSLTFFLVGASCFLIVWKKKKTLL
jgi:hypothetical protein